MPGGDPAGEASDSSLIEEHSLGFGSLNPKPSEGLGSLNPKPS